MPAEHLVNVYGTAVMVCAPDGIPLDTEGAATELVAEALGARAQVVVIPVERLTDDFFDLGSGIAGEITQKFTTYRVRLAIIGDITGRVDASSGLNDWVAQSNQGTDVWFLPTFDGLSERLDRRSNTRPM